MLLFWLFFVWVLSCWVCFAPSQFFRPYLEFFLWLKKKCFVPCSGFPNNEHGDFLISWFSWELFVCIVHMFSTYGCGLNPNHCWIGNFLFSSSHCPLNISNLLPMMLFNWVGPRSLHASIHKRSWLKTGWEANSNKTEFVPWMGLVGWLVVMGVFWGRVCFEGCFVHSSYFNNSRDSWYCASFYSEWSATCAYKGLWNSQNMWLAFDEHLCEC